MKGASNEMKILFVTDLHGVKWKYERLFEVAKSSEVKVVINGGDMLPKHGDLFKQGEFIANYLDDYLSRFDLARIYYLSFLANDDLRIFDGLFEETCAKYPFVISLAQRKFAIEGYEFIGMNWVVDYPFRLKDRCRKDADDYVYQEQLGTALLSTPNGWKEITDWFSYSGGLPTIEDEINGLVRPDNMKNCVYVIHMPPSHLGLDKCYDGIEVGSTALYRFLEKYQPKLSLHGHIHESPEMSGRWYANIGKTVCIQPGQLDRLTYVLIDLATMRFERFTVLNKQDSKSVQFH